MNTVLFVISSVQTVSTFICNYIGRPFREDILENNVLGLSLLGIAGFIANVLFRIHQDLNDMIQVVDVSQYIPFIIGVSLSMVILSFICERACLRLFMIK
jgi:manganese-transporting P-type ATPase